MLQRHRGPVLGPDGGSHLRELLARLPRIIFRLALGEHFFRRPGHIHAPVFCADGVGPCAIQQGGCCQCALVAGRRWLDHSGDVCCMDAHRHRRLGRQQPRPHAFGVAPRLCPGSAACSVLALAVAEHFGRWRREHPPHRRSLCGVLWHWHCNPPQSAPQKGLPCSGSGALYAADFGRRGRVPWLLLNGCRSAFHRARDLPGVPGAGPRAHSGQFRGPVSGQARGHAQRGFGSHAFVPFARLRHSSLVGVHGASFARLPRGRGQTMGQLEAFVWSLAGRRGGCFCSRMRR
mmetsp:Transcript_51840/g.148663  ORF Transcript_51840/g.148663 Transcript_51840/m.148663 type:complete len:290 (+) Transcript_51840:731-1600(+)